MFPELAQLSPEMLDLQRRWQIKQQLQQQNPAQTAYAQALIEPAPDIAQYHPSFLRRLGASIAGGFSGAADPRLGVSTAQDILYSPFQKQLTGYQQRLAQKQQAAELESAQQMGRAKIEELEEQKRAAAARAEAAGAEKKQRETLISPDYLSQRHKEKMEEISARGAAKSKTGKLTPYTFEFPDDKGKFNLMIDESDPKWGDPDTLITPPQTDPDVPVTPVRLGAFKTFYKSVHPSAAQGSFEEQTVRQMNAERQKVGLPDLTAEEVVSFHNKWAQPPELAGQRTASAASSAERPVEHADARLDRSYQLNVQRLDKISTPIRQRLDRMQQLMKSLQMGTPISDAITPVQLLVALAGGQGSGVRITQPELQRIIGGRSVWESLRAFAQKWSLNPKMAGSLTPEQRSQMMKLTQVLMDDLQGQVDEINEANGNLIKSDSVEGHRKILNDLNKGLTGPAKKKDIDWKEFLK